MDRIQAMEGRDGVLSISIAHGFYAADVPEVGNKVLVYTDGDRPRPRHSRRRSGGEVIGMRRAAATPQH